MLSIRVALSSRLSEQTRSDGDADQNEHASADLLAPFTDPAAEAIS